MKDLLPAIIFELGFNKFHNQHLSNKTKNFKYNDDDTLATKGTEEQDYCLLTYEFELGKPEPINFEQRTSIQKKNIKFHIIKKDTFPQITLQMLLRNEGSLSFLVHKYFELEDECKNHKFQVKLLSAQKHTKTISAILFILAQIVTGFGINLMTQSPNRNEGWIVLGAGICIFTVGLFFSFWHGKAKTIN
jgi:hypothetical protein